MRTQVSQEFNHPQLQETQSLTIHRFGMDCIFEWLTPTNFPNRNSCPVCRAVFFEIDTLDDDYPEPVYVGDSEAETERYDDDEFDDPSAFWEDWASEPEEEYSPRHDRSRVLPELCVLLGQRTQALYIAGSQDEYISALDLVEPVSLGETQMPEGFTLSRQILALVREFPLAVFDQILVANAPSQIHIIAPRLAAIMGRLAVRFGAQMGNAGFPVPWGPQGPSPRNFREFNIENFRLMKDGVRLFVRFEEGRGMRPGLVIPGVTGMDFGTAPEPTARRRSY